MSINPPLLVSISTYISVYGGTHQPTSMFSSNSWSPQTRVLTYMNQHCKVDVLARLFVGRSCLSPTRRKLRDRSDTYVSNRGWLLDYVRTAREQQHAQREQQYIQQYFKADVRLRGGEV